MRLNKTKFLGFTLLELLITMGIIVVISVIAVPSLIGNREAKSLDSAYQEINSYLKYAQQKSTSQEGGNQWGIHFVNPASGTGYYSLFTGATYTTPIETRYLPSGVSFRIPSASSTLDISFSKLTGCSASPSSQNIQIANKVKTTKDIFVCPQGLISDTSSLCGVCGGN